MRLQVNFKCARLQLRFIKKRNVCYFEASNQLFSRCIYQPRGRMWGGTSSLNAMVYMRGHAYDYDNWEKQGAQGWSYADCLPYFKKSQTHELGMKFGFLPRFKNCPTIHFFSISTESTAWKEITEDRARKRLTRQSPFFLALYQQPQRQRK